MTINDRQFSRLVLTALTIGFFALVFAGGALIWSAGRNETYTGLVAHTYEVKGEIAAFEIALERAEASRRGYLLDDDPQFDRNYRMAVDEFPRALDRIERLVWDNRSQQRRIARLRPLVDSERQKLDRSMALARAGERAAAVSTFNVGATVRALRVIRAAAREMDAEENRLLTIRDADEAAGVRTLYALLAAASLVLALVAAGAFWVIRRYTRDLAGSRDSLAALNANLEGAVAERTSDLQRANDEIQRFAYIVSHDLRSPLVNVMGFTAELDTATKSLGGLIDRAEKEAPGLVTQDARQAAREDLPEAIRFIRSSTQKMDRLINAILQLSREGRRTIRPEPVNMEATFKGITDSLEHRLDELGVNVEIQKPLPGITSDRLAIEQIFSNLIENAVKYLKPGRPGRISVRGERDRDRIVYEIEDNGRGIDPRDHERIFDLFRRSGPQDQPGEGIGLAHVRALAYRLGGTISCESALDAGATFRVSFPTTYAA